MTTNRTFVVVEDRHPDGRRRQRVISITVRASDVQLRRSAAAVAAAEKAFQAAAQHRAARPGDEMALADVEREPQREDRAPCFSIGCAGYGHYDHAPATAGSTAAATNAAVDVVGRNQLREDGAEVVAVVERELVDGGEEPGEVGEA